MVDHTPSHSGHAICLCLWIVSHSRINSKPTLNFAKSLAPEAHNHLSWEVSDSSKSCSSGVVEDRNLGLPDRGTSRAVGDAVSWVATVCQLLIQSFCAALQITVYPDRGLGTVKALSWGRLIQVQKCLSFLRCHAHGFRGPLLSSLIKCMKMHFPCSSFPVKLDFLLLFVLHAYFFC